ncbi:hypothetical protein [Arthrobacter burdickii]|uniref:Cell wall-binding repeat 2 family protein n=1 Tax=Arthrobacter burdickii TaxID=3035920 RepID=A0ABT8K2M7_9MICC|nr:hypothetical protein [Arthrobacter burdickii]MDN4611676.1 hypothetical protein [Arthrobacter burdickii]
MSALLFDRSPAAVVLARRGEEGPAPDAELATASSAAAGLHVPLLVVDRNGSDGAEVMAELDRLGAETVIGYGDPTADWEALAGPRDLVSGPTTAAGFEPVLGLSVTPLPVAEPGVVASVGALGGPDPRLLTLEPAAPAAPDAVPDTAPDPLPDASAPDASAAATSAPSPGAGLADLATTEKVPDFTPAAQPDPALVLATPSSALAPLATARAAGADVELVAEADPRATGRSVDAVRSHADRAILAVGDAFGSEEIFTERIRVAATAAQLPGGGQTIFPGRRMVALYGHPSGPYLGALGEQGIEATLARVKDLAAQYQPFSDEPVIPALDLIATVASADPGADGDYSSETSIDELEPWIDAAEEQGVYVVLDLQSGRSDFLSQAKLYEELLARPSVGLALDPEWRLLPGQQPLEQIGTVGTTEINAATTWLADLTRDRALPQKLLMVHQFRIDMISEREDLDVSRTELAVTLHADGHGTPAQKLDTWFALQAVPPEGTWPSWKNFYDEDQPMLTPEQTYTLVDPKPWLVTYQ